MKVEVFSTLFAGSCLWGNAQIGFSNTDLPSHIGQDYYRSCVGTGLANRYSPPLARRSGGANERKRIAPLH